jgi:hypothetical protein
VSERLAEIVRIGLAPNQPACSIVRIIHALFGQTIWKIALAPTM